MGLPKVLFKGSDHQAELVFFLEHFSRFLTLLYISFCVTFIFLSA